MTIALISATAVVLAALVGVFGQRNARRLDQAQKQLGEIHVLVNSRLTEALDRINSLETALHLATGIPQEMIQKDLPSAAPPDALPQP